MVMWYKGIVDNHPRDLLRGHRRRTCASWFMAAVPRGDEWQAQGTERRVTGEFKDFYSSTAWKRCREGYKKKVGGLCERCLKHGRIEPAEVIHHRIHLTPENIHDPRIALSWDNLEALCWSCHETEHKGKAKRYTVDAEGRVTARE